MADLKDLKPSMRQVTGVLLVLALVVAVAVGISRCGGEEEEPTVEEPTVEVEAE